jgi:hypothetical protein
MGVEFSELMQPQWRFIFLNGNDESRIREGLKDENKRQKILQHAD